MKKLLAPFDREFKEVLETINMQGSLDILILKKSSMEGKKSSNRPQIHCSRFRAKKKLNAGIEVWQCTHSLGNLMLESIMIMDYIAISLHTCGS